MCALDRLANAGNSNCSINNFDNDMKNLPPMRAVVAFEACYRLRSFTRAASALNVRQPAISHQIRVLEEDLGTKLFKRLGARISPTREADEFYIAVSSGLAEIVHSAERLRHRSGDGTLSLATYSGIAAFWLLPRLARADHPNKPAFRVTTADRDADIPFDSVDAAVLFGHGDWPGFEAILLARERVVPVAAPALAEVWRHRAASELVESGPLIHLEDPEERWFTWEEWRAHACPGTPAANAAFTVTNHGIAIQEATLGAGIALGWAGVVDDLLNRGALVALSDDPLTSQRGYYLVLSDRMRATPQRDWLMGALEIAGDTEHAS